jgi:hypothetical protein
MDALRIGNKVLRVTVLERDAATGNVVPVVLFRGKKKRKSTRAMKPVERIVRRIVDSQGTLATSYVTRHDKSNRKKRDGWVRDLNLNLARASRKGMKRLRINRWLEF